MLKTLLVTSMLASAVAASPVWGQMTQIGSVVITPAQSDEYVIEQLVRLYRKTPATYAQSLAFLQAQRPYLVGRFNKLTLRGPTPKVLTSAAVTATAPAATGGTATTRTVRPKPASAGDKPATASVYDGQTAMQNNGVFIALGVLGLAAAAGAGGGGDADGASSAEKITGWPATVVGLVDVRTSGAVTGGATGSAPWSWSAISICCVRVAMGA
jgi:hypothetical protein